jgi:hypothetical protein
MQAEDAATVSRDEIERVSVKMVAAGAAWWE